jgi:hypothetical protein
MGLYLFWEMCFGKCGIFEKYFCKRVDQIMFWKKGKSELPAPKSLPNPVGREIVTKRGGDPDKI